MKANIDIQPVFNHFKAVTYMCAYFSKAEDRTSEAMNEAAKDAFNRGVSEVMYKVGVPIKTTDRDNSIHPNLRNKGYQKKSKKSNL